VLREIALTVPLLMVSFGSVAEKADPLCVLDPAQMPASWQPSAEMKKGLDPAPWSESEAKDARYSIETGLNEMVDFFKSKPSAIESLWADSVEALMQVTYSSANSPEFDEKVREAARTNLSALITAHFNAHRDPKADCDEFERLLPLALFAHKLYPADDSRTTMVTKRTNAAYRACGCSERSARGLHLGALVHGSRSASGHRAAGRDPSIRSGALEVLRDLSARRSEQVQGSFRRKVH
jgi:hypothetical protein